MQTFNVNWIYDAGYAGPNPDGAAGYRVNSAVENRPRRLCGTPGDERATPPVSATAAEWAWNSISGGDPVDGGGHHLDRDGNIYNRDVFADCSFTTSGFSVGSDATGTFSYDDSATTAPVLDTPTYYNGTGRRWNMQGYNFGVANWDIGLGSKPSMTLAADVLDATTFSLTIQWKVQTYYGYTGLTGMDIKAGTLPFTYTPSISIVAGLATATVASMPISSDNIYLRLTDAYGGVTLWNRLVFSPVLGGIGQPGAATAVSDPDTDGIGDLDASPTLFIGCGSGTATSCTFYQGTNTLPGSVTNGYQWSSMVLAPGHAVTPPAATDSPTTTVTLPAPYYGILTWTLKVATDLGCALSISGQETLLQIYRRIGIAHDFSGITFSAVQVGSDVQVYSFADATTASKTALALIADAEKPSLTIAPGTTTLMLHYHDRVSGNWLLRRSNDYGATFEDWS